MAEAIILLVLGKISSTVSEEAIKPLYSKFGKEVSLLREVGGRLKHIATEFTIMKAFLNRAETIELHEVEEAWLHGVREVAHEVEDILDEYAYIIGELHSRSTTHCFKRILYKFKSVVSLHDIANKLEEIEKRLQKISEMRLRYDIKIQGENSSNIVSRSQEPPYPIDQDELVGIEEEKERLIKWLKEDETTNRSIITVWGMGGLGKTSLVTNVFNSREVKGHFDCYFWITVSQKYKVVDILKKIVKDAESMDYLKLVQTVKETLEGKKYLIILDDVWGQDVWTYLDGAFVNSCNGSKIVITTRSAEVAALCGERYLLELKSLRKQEAWDLFCRRAFTNEERRCPEAVEEWARKIVSKCQGLPLALVVIGSLMSVRPKTETEWRRFYNQFNWELCINENPNGLNWVKSALNLSYHYLPSYLKSCFLYCSIFPEDYLIKSKKLIRLWIAEGFISLQGRGRQTHEELAQGYLNELIQRCMLQVVERGSHGRVKACRIHDIVRELTITTSREQDFCVVVDDQEQIRKGDKVRRLSIHKYNNDILRGINLLPLRSFISFDTTLKSSLPILSSFISGCKYLQVLDLQEVKIKSLPDGVVDLFNLHHLGLRYTDINQLPDSIGRLHNLQTLDLKGTFSLKKLPESIGRLHNLQTLDLSETVSLKKLPHGVTELKNLRHLLVFKARAPDGLAALKNLQTLAGVGVSKNLERELGNLKQLRYLYISDMANCAELCTSIAEMPYLYSLHIISDTLSLVGLDHPLHHLEKLILDGSFAEGEMPSSFFCSPGNSLRRLRLLNSGLREDPLPSLFHLSNLTSLELTSCYVGQQLWFRQGCFPHLTILRLYDLKKLEKVEIENGALQSLEILLLFRLNCLVSVPSGIEFLTSLKVLRLKLVREELVERIKEADYSKISHIPTIQLVYRTSTSKEFINTTLSLLLKKGGE